VTGTGKTLVAARLIDEPARVGAEASSQAGRGAERARRRQAGRELLEGGMSAETLAAVSREVATLEECVRMMNE